ncbi:hypothetical protein LXL04_012625 [Taraxacum kok-saghyz]
MTDLQTHFGGVCFFEAKTFAVCGPHLQASAAEEVDQTSAASRWSGFAPETPASIGAEGWRVAGLKTGDEQRPMVEKDRQQKRTVGLNRDVENEEWEVEDDDLLTEEGDMLTC